MSTILNWSLSVCILYGTLSFTQTINSKILYKTLGFQYYSFSFFLQRIITVIIYILSGRARCHLNQLKWIIPFTLSMCTLNLLSSFCITVMPLAAFASFKKMTIFFVWIVGVLMKSPHKFSNIQYFCIGIITFGAILVGIQDIANGQMIGYIACICYDLSEAISLQYSNYLSRTRKITPFDMLFFNALLSLPYYGTAMIYQQEIGDIYEYFQNVPPHFYFSFVLMLILGCTSELVANFVVMKISPFYKATVSNLKDVIILIASIQYFGDFTLSVQNMIGLFLVFAGSLIYSLPMNKAKQQIRPNQNQDEIQNQNDLTNNSLTQLQVQDEDFLRKIQAQIGQDNENNINKLKMKPMNRNIQNSLKARYDCKQLIKRSQNNENSNKNEDLIGMANDKNQNKDLIQNDISLLDELNK